MPKHQLIITVDSDERLPSGAPNASVELADPKMQAVDIGFMFGVACTAVRRLERDARDRVRDCGQSHLEAYDFGFDAGLMSGCEADHTARAADVEH